MLKLISVERDSTGLLDVLFASKTRRFLCWKRQSLSSLIDRIVKRSMHGFMPRTSLWEVCCDDETIAYIEYYYGEGYRCEFPRGNRDISSLYGRKIRCKFYKNKCAVVQKRY